MKKVHVSTIPGLKSRIDLITIFTLAGLVLQAVNIFRGGIRLLTVVLYLVSLGINLLLVCNLYGVLKRERTYKALGVISTTLKVVFIGVCVFMGIFLLLGLFCVIIFIIGRAETVMLLISIAFLPVGTTSIIIIAKFYRYTSKVASQLRNNEYDGSKKPETWALINAVSILVLMIIEFVLAYIAPRLIASLPSNGGETMTTMLMEMIPNEGSRSLLSSLMSVALSLLQCASCYAVYLLLKTVRLNMPVPKK